MNIQIPEELIAVLAEVTNSFDINELHCDPEEGALVYYTSVIRVLLDRIQIEWKVNRLANDQDPYWHSVGTMIPYSVAQIPDGKWLLAIHHRLIKMPAHDTLEAAQEAAVVHYRISILESMIRDKFGSK